MSKQRWTIVRHSSGEEGRWNVIDEHGDLVVGYLSTDRARLVSAAPELLAECQAVRAIFAAYLSAGHNSPGPTSEDIGAAFWRLEALLGRIEGGEV